MSKRPGQVVQEPRDPQSAAQRLTPTHLPAAGAPGPAASFCQAQACVPGAFSASSSSPAMLFASFHTDLNVRCTPRFPHPCSPVWEGSATVNEDLGCCRGVAAPRKWQPPLMDSAGSPLSCGGGGCTVGRRGFLQTVRLALNLGTTTGAEGATNLHSGSQFHHL